MPAPRLGAAVIILMNYPCRAQLVLPSIALNSRALALVLDSYYIDYDRLTTIHDGNYEDAAALYDEAIRIASDHRFIHEQALASERCGMFYSSRMSNAQTAAAYFTKAAEMYMKWGAKRKAADLLQMLTK